MVFPDDSPQTYFKVKNFFFNYFLNKSDQPISYNLLRSIFPNAKIVYVMSCAYAWLVITHMYLFWYKIILKYWPKWTRNAVQTNVEKRNK